MVFIVWMLMYLDRPERCTIRMQLLASDGKQHRSAHQPVIIAPTSMVLPVGELSVTASSTLLVLRVLSGDRRHLWVWNWCTAQVLLDTVSLSMELFHTICLTFVPLSHRLSRFPNGFPWSRFQASDFSVTRTL